MRLRAGQGQQAAADEKAVGANAPGAAYAKVPIGTDAVATCVCMMYRARPTSCDDTQTCACSHGLLLATSSRMWRSLTR